MNRQSSNGVWKVRVVALIIGFSFVSSYQSFSDEMAPELKQAQGRRVAAVAKATKPSICVFGPGSLGGGSGVVISSDGYALTNYHVVQACKAFMKCSMPDGKLYDAVIVGIDPTGDVALIKLLGRNDFPAADIADSDNVRVGEFCFAIGNPFLLATNFEPSVSWGIVSGIHRYQYPSGTILEYTDCIQTDAAINPGNSGGPLFNANGQLIGVNGRGSFEKRGRVNVGVGYAISINQIKNFLSQLKSGRIVDHATIGATVATDDQGAVRVSEILESSEAYRRGLSYDDEILKFAGRDIRSVNQFKNVLGIFPKGWRLPIVFRNENTIKEITVRLDGVHSPEQLAEMVQGSPQAQEKKPPSPNGPSKSPLDAVETVPEMFRQLYQFRAGFANYHFNLEHQNRVWQGFLQHGDFTDQSFGWRLSGVNDQNQNVTIVLRDSESGIRIENDSFVLDSDEDLALQLDPPGSGGLLVSLHLWRRFLTLGPKKFGDTYYFGTLPKLNDPTTTIETDILIATRGAIESHYFFDTAQNQLASMEMYPDVHTDACRLQFSNYQVHGDLTVPGTIRFSTGNSTSHSITINTIEFLDETPSRAP